MGRLEGKVAIITGGAQGMGAAHARLSIEQGAKVAIADIRVQNGQSLSEELGPACKFFELDVTNEESWADTISDVEKTFGPVDILVNNAGISDMTSLHALTQTQYRKVVDVNQVSVFLGMKAAVPSMTRAGGGSIVNISSLAGLSVAPNLLAYSASKFAVTGMTMSAALDLAQSNIRVNSIHPGTVETPMLGGASLPPELIEQIPMRRIAEPREVSYLVLFLASDEASYCTGGQFVVDGGLSCAYVKNL